MKYIAKKGYTDIVLNRHVDKDEDLREIYEEAGITLTEERINYLVEERKLYKTKEVVDAEDIKEIVPVDEVPEGEIIVDEVQIIESEETKQEENEKEESQEVKENEITQVETNTEEGGVAPENEVELEEQAESEELKQEEESEDTKIKNKRRK